MKMRRDIGIEADGIVNAPYKHALPAHLNAKAKVSPDQRGGISTRTRAGLWSRGHRRNTRER